MKAESDAKSAQKSANKVKVPSSKKKKLIEAEMQRQEAVALSALAKRIQFKNQLDAIKEDEIALNYFSLP